MRGGGTCHLALLLVALITIPGCLGGVGEIDSSEEGSSSAEITLTVWSTYEADSLEEALFLAAVEEWQDSAEGEGVNVDVSNRPFMTATDAFRVAAQGGEAPDLMRFSSDQLGQIGSMRVDGYGLLEDLRPHLTPSMRAIYAPDALHSMRVGNDLYGLPASLDCVSLLYNVDTFASEGISPPDENWTWEQMLDVAEQMTHSDQVGLSVPVKDPFRWLGIQRGYGGSLFDGSGNPTLDSNGSSEGLDAWIGLDESNGGVVPTGTSIESMKNQFIGHKAAMIIDGPWNWATYEQARVNVAQAPLPVVASTGERISPMVSYKGWSVSKQSLQKEASVSLALWLTSPQVQHQAALETYTMPTAVAVQTDSEVQSDPVLAGFLQQAEWGFAAPTTQAMSMIWDPLSSALEQVYAGSITADDALQAANQQLLQEMGA